MFKVKRKQHEQQHTLFPMCGHVSYGPDFHVVCRQCELLSRGSFCCRTEKTRCHVGRRLAEVDSKFLSQVVVSRKTTKDGISHRGNYVQLEHCGTDPVLHTSVLARISFALERVLSVFVRLSTRWWRVRRNFNCRLRLPFVRIGSREGRRPEAAVWCHIEVCVCWLVISRSSPQPAGHQDLRGASVPSPS